jgi:molybdenum cofactor cytidylyltransferase
MSPPGLILLAAGGSTRMGQRKQLLPWKGRSLLRHCAQIALSTPCRPVIVVLGCAAEACTREIENLEVFPHISVHWKDGLGRSLAEGVMALENRTPDASGALIMLADQPTVTSDLLGKLLARWSPPVYSVAATKYQDGFGVPAIFHRDLFPKLRDLQGNRGARALITQQRDHAIFIAPEIDLVDMDTPEIYREHAP